MAIGMKPGWLGYNVMPGAGPTGPSRASTAVDLTPMGLLNDANNYVLQQDSVYSILQCAWTGVLLPTTEEGFWARVQVSGSITSQLSDLVQPLLQSYARAKGHCTTFRQTTYPSIVSLASDVYDYAQNAGGNVQDSFYANIVQSVGTLATATSQAQKDSLIETINALVDMQAKSIADHIGTAQAVMDKVREFGMQTKKDEVLMRECEDAIIKKLKEMVENVDELQKQIESCREKLQVAQAEYEHQLVLASLAPIYAWIPGIGVVIATIAAAAYAEAAARVADGIEELQKLLDAASAQEGTKADATRIIAFLTAVDAGVGSLHGLSGNVVSGIEDMVAIWFVIAEQLDGLKDLVSKDPVAAEKLFAAIDPAKMVAQWNALADAADRYRKAAFVVEVPQDTSSEEVIDQLRKHGQHSK